MLGAALDEAVPRAASEGRNDEIRRLQARGANVNATDVFGFFPLYVAAIRGRVESLRMLDELGVDVDKCNNNGSRLYLEQL